MGLQEYHAKRRFSETPEPEGRPEASDGPLRFVIQKHGASHLHYDFRLEMDGVMKSWAVPKGPSLNPADKRLAMMTEDHPLDYRHFEGVIPADNYGAGTVMIWDEGTYTAKPGLSREESERLLLAGLKAGKLEFILDGHKLHGEFTLVKMRGARYAKENSWLLIKHEDAYVEARDVRRENTSVRTNRTLADIRSQEGGPSDPDALAAWDRDFETATTSKTGTRHRKAATP